MSGLPEPGTRRSRLLAVGLLALVAGAVVRFGFVPVWLQYQRNVEALKEQRYQLDRYRKVGRSLAERKSALEQVTAADEIGRYVLSEQSPALAAAALQETVKSLVVESGGKLTSVRVLPTKPEGAFERISVNVRATLENEALQKVLYALESAVPYLTVDNLVVTSRQHRIIRRSRRRLRGVPEPTSLEVTFDLAGLMRPGAQGA